MKLIPLTQGKFAQVDDGDYEWLNQWKWYAHKAIKTFYAYRILWNKKTQTTDRIIMHRLILGLTDPKILGDHKDHNGLNNQRFNIRPATHSENAKNTTSRGSSKFLGVSCERKYHISVRLGGAKVEYVWWIANININGKHTRLGAFKNEIDAARAYDEAAIIHHKEFANLNFKHQPQ